MSITLSKVEYTYFGSITSELADFLDSIASDTTPTRMYLSGDDTDRIGKLRGYAKSHPDDADSVSRHESRITNCRICYPLHLG